MGKYFKIAIVEDDMYFINGSVICKTFTKSLGKRYFMEGSKN